MNYAYLISLLLSHSIVKLGPLISLLFIFNSTICIAQKSGIGETINYINESLNSHKVSYDDHAKIEWSLTNNGELIIQRYWYGRKSSYYKVHVSYLDPALVYIASEVHEDSRDRHDYIHVLTKDRKEKIKYVSNTANNYTHYIVVIFQDSADLERKLRNAIANLIDKAKKKYPLPSGDPFDY